MNRLLKTIKLKRKKKCRINETDFTSDVYDVILRHHLRPAFDARLFEPTSRDTGRTSRPALVTMKCCVIVACTLLLVAMVLAGYVLLHDRNPNVNL